LAFENLSDVSIDLSFNGIAVSVKPNTYINLPIRNVKKWTAESPALYTITLSSQGEKIIEKIGFRQVSIDGKVFKINGQPIKLKGVNRHDFNYKTGATVTVKDIVKDLKLMKSLNLITSDKSSGLLIASVGVGNGKKSLENKWKSSLCELPIF
jgi:hypothetical protein